MIEFRATIFRDKNFTLASGPCIIFMVDAISLIDDTALESCFVII